MKEQPLIFPVLSDVADRAGVSVSTVSRVLTGHTPVSAKLRAKVMMAVAELGYRLMATSSSECSLACREAKRSAMPNRRWRAITLNDRRSGPRSCCKAMPASRHAQHQHS